MPVENNQRIAEWLGLTKLAEYRDSGMVDIHGKPILEGSIIRADGYGSDLGELQFYCVAFYDNRFTSCIYGDADPISSYRTIEVIGHAEDYRELYEKGGWTGNLGEGLADTPAIPDFTTFAGMEVLLKGLEERDCSISASRTPEGEQWYVLLTRDVTEPFNDTDLGQGVNPTLPLALTEAVLKLIEQGETNG